MGETQETQKAFQKEIQKARKEGNTNRISKLMKMQPEMMKKQQEASSGSMKSMLFLIIFILAYFYMVTYFSCRSCTIFILQFHGPTMLVFFITHF